MKDVHFTFDYITCKQFDVVVMGLPLGTALAGMLNVEFKQILVMLMAKFVAFCVKRVTLCNSCVLVFLPAVSGISEPAISGILDLAIA